MRGGIVLGGTCDSRASRRRALKCVAASSQALQATSGVLQTAYHYRVSDQSALIKRILRLGMPRRTGGPFLEFYEHRTDPMPSGAGAGAAAAAAVDRSARRLAGGLHTHSGDGRPDDATKGRRSRTALRPCPFPPGLSWHGWLEAPRSIVRLAPAPGPGDELRIAGIDRIGL